MDVISDTYCWYVMARAFLSVLPVPAPLQEVDDHLRRGRHLGSAADSRQRAIEAKLFQPRRLRAILHLAAAFVAFADPIVGQVQYRVEIPAHENVFHFSPSYCSPIIATARSCMASASSHVEQRSCHRSCLPPKIMVSEQQRPATRFAAALIQPNKHGADRDVADLGFCNVPWVGACLGDGAEAFLEQGVKSFECGSRSGGEHPYRLAFDQLVNRTAQDIDVDHRAFTGETTQPTRCRDNREDCRGQNSRLWRFYLMSARDHKPDRGGAYIKKFKGLLNFSLLERSRWQYNATSMDYVSCLLALCFMVGVVRLNNVRSPIPPLAACHRVPLGRSRKDGVVHLFISS